MTRLDFYEAEHLAWRLVGERAHNVPGLLERPSSPLHPWRWRTGQASVDLWIRFRPGEEFEEDGAHFVRCAPRLDVNLNAYPRGGSPGEAGSDMERGLRLCRAVQTLATGIADELKKHDIVRRLVPVEIPTGRPRAPSGRG